jgi:hypothetical protein
MMAQVSFIAVHNAAIQENEYWALADALVTLVSDAEALVIAAALHLPYAKPLSATMTPIANVYHSVLNAASSPAEAEHRDRDGPVVTFGASASSLAHVDSSWEIKDKFLSMLVHFLKVEQSPRTHFLLAKGYKPGRDHAGTYEVRFGVSFYHRSTVALPLTLVFFPFLSLPAFVGGGFACCRRGGVYKRERRVRHAHDQDAVASEACRRACERECAARE